MLAGNYYLHQAAKEGYRSYLNAYASHSLRSVFDVGRLDLVKVAKGFGFETPPRVDLVLGRSMRDRDRGRREYGRQNPRGGRGRGRGRGRR